MTLAAAAAGEATPGGGNGNAPAPVPDGQHTVARMRGPILCFVGPPGVGKTSLGQSIARAMNRKFVRISLGGVRDEAEIRGHRGPTSGRCPGACPGPEDRRLGQPRPHAGRDRQDQRRHAGRSAAALLEVLDPAQNHAFRDHYVEIPIDLSRVLFIATANQLGTIHPACSIEWAHFAERLHRRGEGPHRAALPGAPADRGERLEAAQIQITDDALRRVISEYRARPVCGRWSARSAPSLARSRHVWRQNPNTPPSATHEIDAFLGPPRFRSETAFRTSRPGVATGVAWTEAGGDVLFIEASLMPGNGHLTLTGQLGNVMQESARAALSHIRQRATELGIPPDFLSKQDLHIHVPAGAIPKDGPSAGVTMATAIVSAARGIPVEADVAMTGEITLSGLVLPSAASARSARGPPSWSPDVRAPGNESPRSLELPAEVREDITFVPVSTLEEVLRCAPASTHA